MEEGQRMWAAPSDTAAARAMADAATRRQTSGGGAGRPIRKERMW
jgi:hypothetical protein